MKRLSLLIIATVFLTFGVSNVVRADDGDDEHTLTVGVTTHAVVDIETTGGSTAISLAPAAPDEAGEGLDFTDVENNDLWLNYSSIVSTSEAKNKITAKIANGTLPVGMKVKLTVAADAGSGNGSVGTALDPIYLTGTEQDVINNIGSGYTGTGANNGHNLTYSLELDETVNYNTIVANSADVNIEYTITAVTAE